MQLQSTVTVSPLYSSWAADSNVGHDNSIELTQRLQRKAVSHEEMFFHKNTSIDLL